MKQVMMLSLIGLGTLVTVGCQQEADSVEDVYACSDDEIAVTEDADPLDETTVLECVEMPGSCADADGAPWPVDEDGRFTFDTTACTIDACELESIEDRIGTGFTTSKGKKFLGLFGNGPSYIVLCGQPAPE